MICSSVFQIYPMMKLCLIVCLATISLSSPLALHEEWQQWKQQHAKTYANDVEESVRRAVWFRAYHNIEEHNNAKSNLYHLGLNRFADMVSSIDLNPKIAIIQACTY